MLPFFWRFWQNKRFVEVDVPQVHLVEKSEEASEVTQRRAKKQCGVGSRSRKKWTFLRAMHGKVDLVKSI